MNGYHSQEIPSNHEAKCVVHPFSSQSNETTTDWKCRAHFCDRIVDHSQHTTLDGVGNKQAASTSMVETGPNAHEQGCTNGSSDGDELDLAIVKVTLKLVGVAGQHPLRDLSRVSPRGAIATILLFVFAEDTHRVGCVTIFGRSQCQTVNKVIVRKEEKERTPDPEGWTGIRLVTKTTKVFEGTRVPPDDTARRDSACNTIAFFKDLDLLLGVIDRRSALLSQPSLKQSLAIRGERISPGRLIGDLR